MPVRVGSPPPHRHTTTQVSRSIKLWQEVSRHTISCSSNPSHLLELCWAQYDASRLSIFYFCAVENTGTTVCGRRSLLGIDGEPIVQEHVNMVFDLITNDLSRRIPDHLHRCQSSCHGSTSFRGMVQSGRSNCYWANAVFGLTGRPFSIPIFASRSF